MTDEGNRVAMLSDVRALEARVTEMEKGLRQHIDGVEKGLRQHADIVAEATRRHFDVVAEQLNAPVKTLAEALSHHRVVLDEHEERLRSLERPKRV